LPHLSEPLKGWLAEMRVEFQKSASRTSARDWKSCARKAQLSRIKVDVTMATC
jgi:hypothetical protein